MSAPPGKGRGRPTPRTAPDVDIPSDKAIVTEAAGTWRDVDEAPRCVRCGRKLRRPDSIEAGAGWRCRAALRDEAACLEGVAA